MVDIDFASVAPITIVIDGPSGAGKTWLANYLASTWPRNRRVEILHMDDVYPGWDGLVAGSQVVSDLLVNQRALSRPVSWQRYDWEKESLTEWMRIPPDVDLIVEGCGALTAGSAAVAQLSIWINADEVRRKARALGRGGESFDEHWDNWDAQFVNFIKIHNPQRLASLVVRQER